MTAATNQNISESDRLPWRDRAFVPLGVAADILGVSRASVYNLEARGELPFSRVAGRTLVPVTDLKALIDTAQPWSASDRGKEARAARALIGKEA